MKLYNSLLNLVQSLATADRAIANTRYFKTGKGQYGYGDVFIGLTVPQSRSVAKQFVELTLMEIEKLLHSKIHEHRLIALEILELQFQKADAKLKKQIVDLYLRSTRFINNWDLVDASAHQIYGTFLISEKSALRKLQTLARSKNLWERRIAIVATYAFIRHGTLEPTIRIAEVLMYDTHDLLHKACGWMLREVGKKDLHTLEKFLDAYKDTMPRTTLRYAIERFTPEKKRYYMEKSSQK